MRVRQHEGTEDRSEPAFEEVKRLVGNFEAAGLSDCCDVYCKDYFLNDYDNEAARLLMPAVDIKPAAVLRGPILFHFRPGICRKGKTSIELARTWFEAYMLDDYNKMRQLAKTTNVDRQRRAAKEEQKIETMLRVLTGVTLPQTDKFLTAIKAEAVAEKAEGWDI